MVFAAFLAITLDPAMRMLFTRMDYLRIQAEWLSQARQHASPSARTTRKKSTPSARFLFRIYEPVCRFVLKHRKATIVGGPGPGGLDRPGLLQARHGVHAAPQRGDDPLHADDAAGHFGDRGPEAPADAGQVLKSLPEVERVFGKAGRAETSTDPAPFSMMETTVLLKPQSEWRHGKRWYASLPGFLQWPFRPSLAGPHLQGRADRRARPEDAVPRRHQRLDDADQGPDRHAHDRRADADRDQDLRRRPEDHRADRDEIETHPAGRQRHAEHFRRAHRRAATSSTSTSAASDSPATA